ncbi:MAG: deaminase [Candidatus Sulfotelmatobacter sp.]
MADKMATMPFRPLKSFFPTADELLSQDLPALGVNLFMHLKSYIGLNTVYQHAGFNKGYFRAMLENRNVGLGTLPKEPEYGVRQPEVTRRMMEAWNWLERQGVLIHNDEQAGDWFIVSSDAEKLLKSNELTARATDGTEHSPRKANTRPFQWEDLDNRLLSPKLQELSNEMQKKSVEGERKAAFDTRQSGNSAGYLPRLFDFQEQLTDEWVQKVYAAHCESWSLQNRTVTGEFIRAIRDRAVIPLIAARKSTVQFEVSLRGTRTGENPNSTALGEWNRRMDRLAARWSQSLEADAVAEEYRESRPAGVHDDRHFALLAIEEAKKSIAEDDRPHPKVGVVIVKNGKALAKAHRGENPKSHAEYVALEQKLSGETVAGATVYTTLEPCTKRNPPKICCAQRLVDRRVARVFIGMLDPNPDIRGLGDQILSEAGIEVQLFPRDLRAQVEEMNREFIGDQKQKFKARQSSAEIPATKQNVVVEAESNVTFDDTKVSIQKVVEDGGRLRLFLPNENAKFMFAATVEVRNHATDGKKTASAGQVKAQLSFKLTQGTYDVAPGAWLDEPYSSVLLDVGDARRLILAVSENWIQDWRMVTNKRTGPTDAPMLDYSRGFPLLATGSLEASIVGSGRVLRKLKARVDWKHNENLMLVPMEEG